MIFGHHGQAYANNMITWYDEHYNQRKREPYDQLPKLRQWDSNKLGWLPERSDHPMRGNINATTEVVKHVCNTVPVTFCN